MCLLAPVAASAQTTTTLSANPTTAAAGGVVTLTATLITASAGQVNVCIAGASACTDVNRVGRAQVMPNGTAVIRIRPSIGAHSYTATYTGTTTVAASSASSPAAVTVTGTYSTTTTIANGGPVTGGYSVTGTVTSTTAKPTNPTGSISFQDSSNSNAVLATGPVTSANPPVLTGTGAVLPVLTTAPQSSLTPVVADFNNDGYIDYAVVTSAALAFFFRAP